jgi:uncharacterized membrane protein YraQ (UPF0718 family)
MGHKMIRNIFWAIGMRTGQVTIESCATILCGLIVAGVMRKMLGTAGTRKLFGGPGWNGLFRAWAVGTVLPVCSLGVIPIAREMRRAGVRSATILAFIMAAPHINPLSFLYGLTMSEPVVIICFALGSLLIALFAGFVWDRFLASDRDFVQPVEETLPEPGMRRIAAVLVAAAHEAVGPSMVYMMIGLLSTGIIAGTLPHGSLMFTMKHPDPFSPVLMAGVATPLYVGSLPGMMRIGLMFDHGNSSGAAFVLFELGIGIGIGTIAWLMAVFGWRRTLAWLAFLTAATLAFAYIAERTLYFAREEANHTHAFDEWTNPFISDQIVDWTLVRDKLLQKVEVLEPAALGSIGCLVVVGLLLDKFDRRGRLEDWLMRRAPSNGPVAVWNRHVPDKVLWGVAFLGLALFSIVGLYLYYPEPHEAMLEITDARTMGELGVRCWNKEEALRQIARWDLLTRKLQVGVFLRTGAFDPKEARLADELRKRLSELRDLVQTDDIQKAKKHILRLEESYKEYRAVYEAKFGAPH